MIKIFPVEKKMILAKHIAELKTRIMKSFLFLLFSSCFGWILCDKIFEIFQGYLYLHNNQNKGQRIINFDGITSAIEIKLKISITFGMLIAFPFILYQIYIYVIPGSTEKFYFFIIILMLISVSLFYFGLFIAFIKIPFLIDYFLSLTPKNNVNYISVNQYFNFIIKTFLSFGLIFLLPILIFILKYLNLITSKHIIKFWRLIIFLSVLIAAIINPVSDVLSLIYLSIFILSIFFVLFFVILLIEKIKN